MGNHSSSEKDTFLNLCQSGDVKRLRALMQEFKIHDLEKFLHFADHNGMTGLHFAAENGHDKVLEFLLLEKHVVFENLLRGTIRANTPLHLAARANRPSCAKVLLRAANQGTWEQCRLLWIALRKDRFTNPECAFARFNKDEIRLLCQYVMRDSEGLNKMILAKNNDDMIPLEYAMKNGSRDVIPLLITPATVKQVRGVLGSPLHYAAAKGSPEACELLLRMKSDNVNCTNMRGETPLFRACCAYPESAETVKLLLKSGADPSVRANSGNSALDESEARKYRESSELIKEHMRKHPK